MKIFLADRSKIALGEFGVDAIEDKLLAKLSEKFGTSPELDDGLTYAGVDSVGMAELTVELESEFGITVTDEIFAVETIRELADYIRDRQQSST